jgi:hypothetical protein
MAFHQRNLLIFSMLLITTTFPAHAAGSGPTISTVSYPSNITSGVPAILSATVSSSATVTSCNLYIDSDDKGAMTLDSGRASKTYLFATGGVVTAFVFCRDSNGGMAHGNLTSIFVGGTIGSQQAAFGGSQPPSQSQDQQTPSQDQASPSAPSGTPPSAGSLIKLACGPSAGSDDPCKAVYYYGSDGKRHAFPNEKSYFTWYANFDSVKEIDAATLGTIPLGKNVTYRPGVRMVKFQTLNNVYAVTKGGVLRWVTTEDVAKSLYGDGWNKKIDDIADTFYSNYTFGSDITNATDFAPASEMSAVQTIDAGM